MDKELARIQDIAALAARFAPGYKIEQKTASRTQRALGWFFRVVLRNPGYMQDFWTTTPNFDGSSTTYRPANTDAKPAVEEFDVIAHELMHGQQAWRYHTSKIGLFLAAVRYAAAYLFPQLIGILGVLALPVWFVLFGWWGFFGLLPVAALGPWPAPFRAAREFEAYRVSLAMYFWYQGGFSDDEAKSKVDWATAYFDGPAYYFMVHDATKIRAGFEAWIDALRAETPETKTDYLVACRALAERYRAEDLG